MTLAGIFVEGGDRWPDVLNGQSGRCTVTERVVHDLHGAGITSFRAVPTTIIQIRGTRLTKRSAPPYFVILPDVGIEIDKVRSGCRLGEVLCQACGWRANHPRGPSGERWGLHVTPGSHSGAHLFGSIDPLDRVFCTRHVLEMARVNRWTGARFKPMDIHERLASCWRGIDYLGKEWPPKAWYPPTPDAGKTPQEWAAQLDAATKEFQELERQAKADEPVRLDRSKPHPLERRLLAIEALEWLGAQAVPLLAALVFGQDQHVARDAASILDTIAEENDIEYPADLKRKIIALKPTATIASW